MQTTTTTVSALEKYLEAYEAHEQAKKVLDEAKKEALEYLKKNATDKLEYGDKKLTVCERLTYSYSPTVTDMLEVANKRKKLEELNGEAKVKTRTDYIRLSNNAA